MIGLLQRVSEACVVVDQRVVGAIGRGLMVLLAVEPADEIAQADRLIERLVGYRVFADGEDRMNLSLADVGGELLLIPQFTLAADTHKGLRPELHPGRTTRNGPPAVRFRGRIRARGAFPGRWPPVNSART